MSGMKDSSIIYISCVTVSQNCITADQGDFLECVFPLRVGGFASLRRSLHRSESSNYKHPGDRFWHRCLQMMKSSI